VYVRIHFGESTWETSVVVPFVMKAFVAKDHVVLLFANQIMLRVPAQEIIDKNFGVARLEPSWTRYLRCQVIQVGL
jgi:hypothetical protein